MIGNDITSSGIKIWDVSSAGSAEWVSFPTDIFGEALFLSERHLLASGGGGDPGQAPSPSGTWRRPPEAHRVWTIDRPAWYRECCAFDLGASSDGATLAVVYFAQSGERGTSATSPRGPSCSSSRLTDRSRSAPSI